MLPGEKRSGIPLSKTKLTLLLLGATAFVVVGLCLLCKHLYAAASTGFGSVLLTIVGVAAVIFFGACAGFYARKLLDNKPGIVFDERGLFDNSSFVAAGQILWADIETVSVLQLHRQKFVVLQVRNPQQYIDRQASAFKRKVMTLNHKLYGTPLHISANGLQVSFDQLFVLITNNLQRNQRQWQ